MTKLEKISIFVFVAVIAYGFVSVTQAGYETIIQNDGNAVFGGLMILAGGIGIGRIVGEVYTRRLKK